MTKTSGKWQTFLRKKLKCIVVCSKSFQWRMVDWNKCSKCNNDGKYSNIISIYIVRIYIHELTTLMLSFCFVA